MGESGGNGYHRVRTIDPIFSTLIRAAVPADTVRIVSADSSRQVEALRMLFSRFPQEEQAARLEDTLLAVQRGALDLTGLMLAEQSGRSVGAALVMRQAKWARR
jgi:hypothetical protein